MQQTDRHRLDHPVRVVTAAALFDGHDAAIHIMRRILQASGAEVIHLGHNRSVEDVAVAAVQEDAHGIAVSSYQGGHMEFFRYLRQRLDALGAPHIKVFGGGGGVIVPEEIAALEAEGAVERIYSPEDGRRLGLQGMIDDMLRRMDVDLVQDVGGVALDAVRAGEATALARAITAIEGLAPSDPTPDWLEALRQDAAGRTVPVVGLTGTGGAGKSSLTDELVARLRLDAPDLHLAVLSVDPTRKRSGGALLGDRIRMNHLDPDHVFFRSLATRDRKGELSAALPDAIAACSASGCDLVLVETSGIGQGDADITDLADVSVYVMTPEYGAPSQLEKIDMLELADLVVVNKVARRGGPDAVRDVRKQVRRNRTLWEAADDALPVFGTNAARFMDDGVTALHLALRDLLADRLPFPGPTRLPTPQGRISGDDDPMVPASASHYLAEIAASIRGYHADTARHAQTARAVDALDRAAALLDAGPSHDAALAARAQAETTRAALPTAILRDLDRWNDLAAAWSGDTYTYEVRGKAIEQPLVVESLAGSRIPRVAFPSHLEDPGARLRFLRAENVPGSFPYTAGVFPLKRKSEEPKRMFAGEGGPARTNHRFHLLCEGEAAHRLSTAFDSVTLYGEDPAERPDIFGKIGESGVSVPHLDDMKILYGGFDLTAPTTSVSMTINGPAPAILAMFLHTAIDDHRARWEAAQGREATPEEADRLRKDALSRVRGTVQADILKEDQAQNTCIFSTAWALRMMGDIQQWFIDNQVRNFYSVSISGYHIAEAGANPITQLALTLANGFTLVEYYRARGMDVDQFAPNLSFFFSNGLDPEYTVLGRVARRIWAVTMRERYGASDRSAKLKYHIQTSGRSLHAREIQFNDIRTTAQAFLALADHCNSLHTNAYDEAITTPTEESVRRAMAIQLILNREFGVLQTENPWQGSFLVDQLTDLVEEHVLRLFEEIDRRGGVLGAMELQFQRSRIQDESMKYERLKHDGSLPIIGVNTFLDPATDRDDWVPETPELRRASPEEKQAQIRSVERFQATHAEASGPALRRLQEVAMAGGNTFDALMDAVRVCTLGQITHALYAVGGAYRRNL